MLFVMMAITQPKYITILVDYRNVQYQRVNICLWKQYTSDILDSFQLYLKAKTISIDCSLLRAEIIDFISRYFVVFIVNKRPL